MFGYVLPHIPNLKVYENEIYRATYCGLCKQIKKQLGRLSRVNLSYDMVFFAIFSICYLEDDFKFEKRFCKLHPFKKKLCLKSCSSLEKAADVGAILFYFKLKDNVCDCKNFKKIFNLFLLFLFKKSYKRAVRNQSHIAGLVSNFIKKQTLAEEKNGMCIDFYADATAECLGKIFDSLTEKTKEKELLYRIGYMLGKYIYLMDALDDLKIDIKTGGFNPVLVSCEGRGSSRKEVIKKVDELLNFSIAQMAEAFEELNFKKEKGILANVIYLGLKAAKNKILLKMQNEKF